MNTEDFRINHAELIIAEDFGDIVSSQLKKKDLIKFGSNPNVGTSSTGYTLWSTGVDQPHETLLANSVNSIDTVSSSSGSDTDIEVVIEGHTDVAGEKTFVTQTATLLGQGKVTLSTPLNRCTRIYNNSGTNLVGGVFVYQDTALTAGKPTDTTKIHISIPAGSQQSKKCATTISKEDYWIVTGFSADVLNKASANAEIELQIRLKDKIFRPVATISASNNHQGFYGGTQPYIIIPKNSDVRLVAIGSAATTSVSGTISGYLAAIK